MAPKTFEADLEQTFQGLRQALIELFVSIEADPGKPYPVALRLGVNKNLTWKAARIIQATDPWTAIRYLPGPSGIKTLLEGFRKGGAPDTALSQVEDAQVRFDELITRHSGDRGTFDLIRDGHDSTAALDESRKLAYRGNSGIFGVQVKSRLVVYALSPFPGGGDATHVTLINAFLHGRRLRAQTSAPLLMLRAMIDDDDGPIPDGPSPGPTRLLDEFCTSPLPTINEIIEGGSRIHMLAPGPIGNTVAFDLVFATEQSFPPHYSPEPNSFAQLQLNLSIPMENLVYDFLVHRDLPQPAETPVFSLVSRFEAFIPPPGARRDAALLPTSEAVTDHGFATPVGTSQVPSYPRILEAALGRNGFKPSDYHTYRVVLGYPPMSTTAVLRYPLPDAPT